MNNILLVFYLLAFLLLQSSCQTKQEQPFNKTLQRIDSLFKAQHQQDLFHGGVVITRWGEVLYENYLGLADRSWNIPVDQDTRFDIASVNKSMIAALVLKAVEEGRLNLNDKLVELLAGFSYQGSFHPDISLHQLLSHSSGLPDYNGVPDQLKNNGYLPFKRLRFSNEAYVDFISTIQPIGQPDSQFYYSNFAYHLLPIILEETYQKPFGKILKEKLTTPLNLHNTLSSGNNETILPRLACGYTYQQETDEWLQNLFIDLSLGRRIFSTPSDLNRWAQVMDNPGWLSEASLNLMQQNHLSAIDSTFSYGYGWVVVDKNNKSRMGDLSIQQPYIIHGGSTEGYKSMLININKGELVISFLSNVGNRTNELKLAKEIVHHLL